MMRASDTRWRIGRELDPVEAAGWIRGDGDGDGSGFALIVDEKVLDAHREWIDALTCHLAPCRALAIVPSGESSKSVSEWERLHGALISGGVRRHDTIVAVGGGVTGDLGGFVAATLHRGMRLVHVPTTLLAIADSSIGGKTGINHPLGKNLIGSFHPAAEIVVDMRLLFSMPAIEWINGFAEVVKYAYIEDPSMFGPVRRMFDVFRLGDVPLGAALPAVDMAWDDLEHLIHRSMQIKTAIVKEDEFEQGRRAILNFGHTFAHAIEQRAGYGVISHGSAVLIGMAAACHLSDPGTANKAIEPLTPFLRAIRPLLPQDLLGLRGSFDPGLLIESMRRDKKNRTESIRFVLLEEIGHAVVREVGEVDRIGLALEFAAGVLNQPGA
jgi:3-dehydroquinate synthase